MNARSKSRRIATGALLFVPFVAGCSMLGTVIGSASDATKIAGGCPDMANLDAIAKINFQDEFALDAAVAGKVKGGVIAAAALKDMAAQIDADLKLGCGGLAKDLGATATFKSGTEACQAAGKAIADIKAKLGAKAEIKVAVAAPECNVSVGLMSECAGKCDANVKPGKAELKCEGGELSGKCDAQCSGNCKLAAAASCAGTCDGACDADFSGTCGGACDGTCDGKKATGSCAGQCKGKCDAQANGTCAGKCDGSCKVDGGAKCDGTCTGTCSVAFQEPSCSGKVVPPEMSAECKAGCEANAEAKLSCTPPHVTVAIQGAADAEAAAKYKTVIEKNLPVIIKVAVGMAPRLGSVLVNGKATLEGGITAATAAAKGRATAAAHIGQCLLDPFKGAISSIVDVQASVKVSVDLKASASGSASAG